MLHVTHQIVDSHNIIGEPPIVSPHAHTCSAWQKNCFSSNGRLLCFTHLHKDIFPGQPPPTILETTQTLCIDKQRATWPSCSMPQLAMHFSASISKHLSHPKTQHAHAETLSKVELRSSKIVICSKTLGQPYIDVSRSLPEILGTSKCITLFPHNLLYIHITFIFDPSNWHPLWDRILTCALCTSSVLLVAVYKQRDPPPLVYSLRGNELFDSEDNNSKLSESNDNSNKDITWDQLQCVPY